MPKTTNRHEPLEKPYRSVPLTKEMAAALKKHVDEHLTVEDAALALGFKRRETLAYILKNGSCSSVSYNKLLVLVNPDLANTQPESENA